MSAATTGKSKRNLRTQNPANDTENETNIPSEDKDDNEKEHVTKKAKIACESSILNRIHIVTANINDQLEAVSVVFLNRSFTPKVQDRLRQIEMLDTLHRYAINLAKAEPKDFEVASKGETIIHKSTHKPAHFWLVGTIQHSALFQSGPRSLSISLSDYTFERALAVVGQIKNTDIIFLPTFNGGVSFSTYRTAGVDSSIEAVGVGPSSPSKGRSNQNNRVNVNAPVTLPYDMDVPAFEGYERLDRNNIKTGRAIKEEIPKNAGVIIGFTIGAYAFKNHKTYTFKSKIVKQSLSLNIQFVVALAGPANPSHLNDKSTSKPAYGVGPALDYDESDEDVIEEQVRAANADEAVEWI